MHWFEIFATDSAELKYLDGILIPGTRRSAAYFSESLTDFQVITQEVDVLGQLLAGARYFEFTVKFDSSSFWIVHEIHLTSLQPLEVILRDIAVFAKSARELVIVHFRGFVDFEADGREVDRHGDFIEEIFHFLGSWMVKKPNTTSNVIGHNSSVLVSYDHRFHEAHDTLWPGFPIVESLEEVPVFSNLPWIFSPTPETKLFVGSEENQVEIFKRALNSSEMWQSLNIVAFDFFLQSDVMDVTHEVNENRVECRKALIEKQESLRKMPKWQGPRQISLGVL